MSAQAVRQGADIKLCGVGQIVEPPTVDSHGGWCGGWELETPGCPIRRHE